MNNVFFEGQVMWSMVDANAHLRHSAYADFAAQARLNLLEKFGLKPSVFLKQNIGPILFREETLYLKEVRPNDMVRVTCELTKSRSDGSRWSIRHEIYRSDSTKAAIINVDGAWIDTIQRKLTALPEELNILFHQTPKSHDYTEDHPQPKA